MATTGLHAFCKVSELAERAGVRPSTVRYYTERGLIPVAGTTRGGYKLYDAAEALARISMIRQMNGSKPTLADVKNLLSGLAK